MGLKSEADIEVEKQELAARHTAQFGKSLGSQPGSEEERRQQALAMLRKKAQAKSDGKRVVADKGMADDAHKQAKRDGKRTAAGDSVTDGANKQAPPKRAKAPRHSSVRALVVENQQQRWQKAELLLPNSDLTPLSTSGDISFDIRAHRRATAHLFGPPRYKFEQCTSVLPLGPLRKAHDQISTLQRWNRAQDRTIFKLTHQGKELKRTVKRQAEASAWLLKKVADVLARGAVAGCKAEDFDLDALNALPAQPLHDPSAPRTKNKPSAA
ncbi:hypothetical protein Bca52824_026808 [Brassica carinata]|uniref:Uncharacterized protein n=1 Tax=Brassica carinata TaxID=52824 RepID=A0A8X7SK54_BRACI|nr:hypothetical protein Bca52824_026808 [Brassica carinata]